MGIFYTQHILERMEQRGISRDMLQYAWIHGDHTIEKDGKIIVTYAHDNRKIKIIAKRKGKHFILVTSYFYD